MQNKLNEALQHYVLEYDKEHPQDHVKSRLESYIEQDNVDAAFMVSGHWAAGKTYAVKQLINQRERRIKNSSYIRQASTQMLLMLYSILLSTGKHFLRMFREYYPCEATSKDYLGRKKQERYAYISLNGITSIYELRASLRSRLSVLSDDVANMAGEVSRDIGGIANSSGFIKSLTQWLFSPSIERYFRKYKVIIVLDDVERSQISLTEFFGEINRYTEEHNVHVIFICAESELVDRHLDLSNKVKAQEEKKDSNADSVTESRWYLGTRNKAIKGNWVRCRTNPYLVLRGLLERHFADTELEQALLVGHDKRIMSPETKGIAFLEQLVEWSVNKEENEGEDLRQLEKNIEKIKTVCEGLDANVHHPITLQLLCSAIVSINSLSFSLSKQSAPPSLKASFERAYFKNMPVNCDDLLSESKESLKPLAKSLSIGASNLDEELNHAVDKLDTQFKEYDVHRGHYDALALLEEGEASQAQKKSTLKNVTEYMNLNKILEITFPFRAYKALTSADRSKNSSLAGSEQKLKEASVKAISDYIKNLKGRVDKIGFDVINDVIRESPLFSDFFKIYTEAAEPKVKGYLKKITDRFLLGDTELLAGIPEPFLFHYQCVVFGDRKDGKFYFDLQLFFNFAHNLLPEVFDANDMGRKLIKWFESEKSASWNVSTLLVLSSASNPAEGKHTNSYKKWLDEIRQYVDCKLPEEVKSAPEVHEFFQRISLTVNDG